MISTILSKVDTSVSGVMLCSTPRSLTKSVVRWSHFPAWAGVGGKGIMLGG